MNAERTLSNGIGAILIIGALAACDTAPTEPQPLNPADAAGLFTKIMPLGGVGDEFSGEVECLGGGSVTFEYGVSYEQEGEITIRRTQLTRRFNECGQMRGAMVITANGEMSMTGEDHISDGDAQWPHGILYKEAHEVGMLSMTYDGDAETHTCETDYVRTFEPATGRLTYIGKVCGIPVNQTRTIILSTRP